MKLTKSLSQPPTGSHRNSYHHEHDFLSQRAFHQAATRAQKGSSARSVNQDDDNLADDDNLSGSVSSLHSPPNSPRLRTMPQLSSSNSSISSWTSSSGASSSGANPASPLSLQGGFNFGGSNAGFPFTSWDLQYSGYHQHNHDAPSATNNQQYRSTIDDDALQCNNSNASSISSCGSKEDRSSYNTRFAKRHLDTFRRNDRMRWNFDFEHNKPTADSSHQASSRYQWEPHI